MTLGFAETVPRFRLAPCLNNVPPNRVAAGRRAETPGTGRTPRRLVFLVDLVGLSIRHQGIFYRSLKPPGCGSGKPNRFDRKPVKIGQIQIFKL